MNLLKKFAGAAAGGGGGFPGMGAGMGAGGGFPGNFKAQLDLEYIGSLRSFENNFNVKFKAQ